MAIETGCCCSIDGVLAELSGDRAEEQHRGNGDDDDDDDDDDDGRGEEVCKKFTTDMIGEKDDCTRKKS